jgi:electron transfer flavoprotein beta subunit
MHVSRERSMKILVACKRVPNPEQGLKIEGGRVDLSGVAWQMNTFDEYAVETALRLTESSKGGTRTGEVVIVSIGPQDVIQPLRAVLAMGADRAILVRANDESLDADVVARVLRKVVEQEQPNLVLLGKQTMDGDSNQVGQLLAGHLGWPQATFLASLQVTAEGSAAIVTREVDGGIEERRVRLPAVATVDLRIIGKRAVRNAALASEDVEWEETQRYASLKGIMAAKKKEIREIPIADMDVSVNPRVNVITCDSPPTRETGIKIDTPEELVSRLHQEAQVIF